MWALWQLLGWQIVGMCCCTRNKKQPYFFPPQTSKKFNACILGIGEHILRFMSLREKMYMGKAAFFCSPLKPMNCACCVQRVTKDKVSACAAKTSKCCQKFCTYKLRYSLAFSLNYPDCADLRGLGWMLDGNRCSSKISSTLCFRSNQTQKQSSVVAGTSWPWPQPQRRHTEVDAAVKHAE